MRFPAIPSSPSGETDEADLAGGFIVTAAGSIRKGGPAMQTADPAQSADVQHFGLQRWTNITAWLSIGVAGVVLAGWILRIPQLASIFPGVSAMKFNSALGFLFAGMALRLRVQAKAFPALAVLVGLIGGLTLAEYAFHVDFGMDELLVRDFVRTIPFPGRMSLASALSFSLLSVTFLMLNRPRLRALTQLLPAAIAVVSYIAVLGFLYGVDALYSLFLFSQIALNTAVIFILLAVGLLTAQDGLPLWAWLLANDEGGRVSRRLLPVALILPVILGGIVIYLSDRRSLDPVVGTALLVVFLSILFFVAVGWNGFLLHSREQNQKTAHRHQMELTVEKERAALLEQFIRSTSHDLRTPLSTINTNAYLAQRTEDAGSRTQRLQQIQAQVDQIRAILDDFSTMARLDAADAPVHREVAIASLVANTVDRAGRAILEKRLHLETAFAPEPAVILGDAAQLATALGNLLDNAVRYTLPGGRITVRTRCGEVFIVEISDTGVGISAADLTRIFERHFKVNEARTSDGSRAGLGLSIAQRIITLHGGRIDVESVVGQGSLFRVTLPLATPR
ncbi:MAG: hypothetical protein JNL42_11690 [Anaerolineae bacterium]|nr:hypothetical protein [Anaerolineae bacterium]